MKDFEIVVITTENLLSFTKPRLSNEDGRFDDCLMEREVGNVVDNGVQPGDGMGGAGTDSTFFSYVQWHFVFLFSSDRLGLYVH